MLYSEDPNLEQAFVDGIFKRADELGMTKEAFLPTLIRIAAPVLSNWGVNKGLERLAAGRRIMRGPFKGKAIPAPIVKHTKGLVDAMKDPFSLKGMAANTGTFMLGDALARPIYDPIARGLEGPDPQQSALMSVSPHGQRID